MQAIDTGRQQVPHDDVTGLLARWNAGDASALSQLVSSVYGYLHRIAGRAMRGERGSHTLQSTALVHEAFVRLAEGAPPRWRDREHFYAVAARLMRHILVDHARRRQAQRRGGGWQRIPLLEVEAEPVALLPAPELLALDQALARLAEVDRRKARVIELRFFVGLSIEETAEVLGVSAPTVILDTRLAKAWLLLRIEGKDRAAG